MESPPALEKGSVSSIGSYARNDGISHDKISSESADRNIAIHRNKESVSMNAITPTECVDHLKFLAALAELQDCIRSSDGLFGINDVGDLTDMLEDADIKARVEEKRWQVYVSRAVHRFEKWWDSLPKYKKPPTVMSLKSFDMDPLTLDDDASISLSEAELPPLGEMMPGLDENICLWC